MQKIILYSDGSYKNKVIGYACSINVRDINNNMKIIYGNSHGKSSIQAELTAIILGLEYILTNILSKNEEFKIEVRTDLITAVDFIEKRQFVEWDKSSWIKNNKPIRSDTRYWYKLSLICKHIGLDNIQFINVTYSQDKLNKMMHYFARKATNEKLLKNRYFNLITGVTCDNYLNNELSKELINLEEFQLDRTKSQMPWCKNKKTKFEESEKIHWNDCIEGEIVNIPVNEIIITEIVHLKANELKFNGKIAQYALKNSIDLPIAIRQIESNKYSLVAGIVRLLSAKALEISTIPAYITDLGYIDFLKKYTEREQS